LSQDCEEFRLHELKGEYASFILDLESEANLLEHVLGCKRCRDSIRRLIEGGRGQDVWWGSLFNGELQSLLGEEGVTFTGRTGECPRLRDYSDVDDFIEDRIRWRAKRLLEIRSYAEEELKALKALLEGNKKS
jgi:hypothetical protein